MLTCGTFFFPGRGLPRVSYLTLVEVHHLQRYLLTRRLHSPAIQILVPYRFHLLKVRSLFLWSIKRKPMEQDENGNLVTRIKAADNAIACPVKEVPHGLSRILAQGW